MSSSIVLNLTFATRQASIYLGIPILIGGVLGGLFNIIVFLSLRTFRQSSCALYLTSMSFVNVGFLLTTTLSRTMISGFGIDWTQNSLFYCKFRLFFTQLCALTSLTCMCLATIDQFFATCSNTHWQQWSSIKLAHRLIAATVLFWMLHGVPFALFYNHIESPITDKMTCTITHAVFQSYYSYVYSLVFFYFLPSIITIFFGFMAHLNVKTMAHRTLPLVRRELDKQLTNMVLVQVVYNFFTTTPFAVVVIISVSNSLISNPVIIAQLQFASVVSFFIDYLSFAVSMKLDKLNPIWNFLIILMFRVLSTFMFVCRRDFANNSSMSSLRVI
jgi:hypothetical protein